jgi:catechol 2,3-dioxygenase-like lactoylglutathione lyase family enzyme
LFSEDPIAAGEWYVEHFGLQRRGPATPSREPRFFRDHQIGPSSSLVIDNVNIIIYPVQYSRKAYAADWQPGQTKISSTKGRVVDHIAFSVDNLAATIDRLNQEGVKIVKGISTDEGGKLKHAFIEGPDYIRIELVEGAAHRD